MYVIDLEKWLEFTADSKIYFKYPENWKWRSGNNRIIIEPVDFGGERIEVELRENLLELDLIDWLSTQVDLPEFVKEEIVIDNRVALVVTSVDDNWLAKKSVLITNENIVYMVSYFTENESNGNIDIFQNIIASLLFK